MKISMCFSLLISFFVFILLQSSCSTSSQEKRQVVPETPKVSDTVFCAYKTNEVRGEEIKEKHGVLMYYKESDYDLYLREAWVINLNPIEDKIRFMNQYSLKEQIEYGENLLLVCKDQFPPDLIKVIENDPNYENTLYEVNVSGFKRGKNVQFKFSNSQWIYVGYKFEIANLKIVPQVLPKPCFLDETAPRKEYVQIPKVAFYIYQTRPFGAYLIDRNITFRYLDNIVSVPEREAYSENLYLVCPDDFPAIYKEAAISPDIPAIFSIKGYKRGDNDQFPFFSSLTKRAYKFEVTSVELVAPYIEPTLCNFTPTETRGELVSEKEGYMYSFTEGQIVLGSKMDVKVSRIGMVINMNGDTYDKFHKVFSNLDTAGQIKYAQNLLFICEDKLPLDIRLKKQTKVRVSGYKRGTNNAFKLSFYNDGYFGYKFEVSSIKVIE